MTSDNKHSKRYMLWDQCRILFGLSHYCILHFFSFSLPFFISVAVFHPFSLLFIFSHFSTFILITVNKRSSQMERRKMQYKQVTSELSQKIFFNTRVWASMCLWVAKQRNVRKKTTSCVCIKIWRKSVVSLFTMHMNAFDVPTIWLMSYKSIKCDDATMAKKP